MSGIHNRFLYLSVVLNVVSRYHKPITEPYIRKEVSKNFAGVSKNLTRYRSKN